MLTTIMTCLNSLQFYATMCSLLLQFTIGDAASKPRLEATSPLNPVEEGGILSLHCQVWNVPSGIYEITMTRKAGGIVDRLSVDENVLVQEDNTFLAVRNLNDGSTVYFLTVMDAKSSDKGSYTCKIVNKDDNEIIESGSVDFEINHFPGDSDPVCDRNEPMTIVEGTELQLTCHSHIANPRVDLEWKKSGHLLQNVEIQETNGRLYATLRYTPTMKDNGVIFQCEVTSSVFPDRVQDCHAGPLTVERNPNAIVTDGIPLLPSKDKSNIPTPPGFFTNDLTPWTDAECRELCSEYSSSPVLYWVITTVVAAVIALIFFIMGITLLIRYYRVTNLHHDTSPYGAVIHAPRDSIYSELESRRSDNKVYMTLEKGDKIIQKAQLHREHQLGHYDTAPSIPKF